MQRNYLSGAPVNDVVIHPNQGELISCDRAGNVRVWDLGENKCTHQLIPEDDVSVGSVTIAADGTLLCAGNNNVRAQPPLSAGPLLAKKMRCMADAVVTNRATSTSGASCRTRT